jgi:hypothetical protein
MILVTALDCTCYGTRRHDDTKEAFSQKHSLDSVVQDFVVEIEDEPDAQLRHSQVCQHLSGVDGSQTFDALDFDDYLLATIKSGLCSPRSSPLYQSGKDTWRRN